VSDKGVTPAIIPKRVADLLDAPNAESPVGIRDQAILAMFAYLALRVDELHLIDVGYITRDGEHTVVRIKGKGNEIRNINGQALQSRGSQNCFRLRSLLPILSTDTR
jgi:site-specific recombinase XerC